MNPVIPANEQPTWMRQEEPVFEPLGAPGTAQSEPTEKPERSSYRSGWQSHPRSISMSCAPSYRHHHRRHRSSFPFGLFLTLAICSWVFGWHIPGLFWLIPLALIFKGRSSGIVWIVLGVILFSGSLNVWGLPLVLVGLGIAALINQTNHKPQFV